MILSEEQALDCLATTGEGEELTLSNQGFSEIGVISKFSNITSLNLAFNQIVSLEAIRSMTALVRLNIMHNAISSLSSLENMKQLKVLRASNNHLSDLSPLRSCPKLTELWVQNNEFRNVNDLKVLSETPLVRLVFKPNQCLAKQNISNEKYRASIVKVLPDLEVLDAVPVSEADRELAAQLPDKQPEKALRGTEKPPKSGSSSIQEKRIPSRRVSRGPDSLSRSGSVGSTISTSSRQEEVEAQASARVPRASSAESGRKLLSREERDRRKKEREKTGHTPSVPSTTSALDRHRGKALKRNGAIPSHSHSGGDSPSAPVSVGRDAFSVKYRNGANAIIVRTDGSAYARWPTGGVAVSVDNEQDGYRMLACYQNGSIAVSFDSDGNGSVNTADGITVFSHNSKGGGFSRIDGGLQTWDSGDVPKEDFDVVLDKTLRFRLLNTQDCVRQLFCCGQNKAESNWEEHTSSDFGKLKKPKKKVEDNRELSERLSDIRNATKDIINFDEFRKRLSSSEESEPRATRVPRKKAAPKPKTADEEFDEMIKRACSQDSDNLGDDFKALRKPVEPDLDPAELQRLKILREQMRSLMTSLK